MTLENTLGDWRPMMAEIIKGLNDFGIKKLDTCDHICYRVETLERYLDLKEELLSYGSLSCETIVSGRKIAIIELFVPISCMGFEIRCLELPAPKVSSFYKEGFEHAEFVISKLDQFVEKYSKLPFNSKAMGRDINPELGLKINEQYQVKFHPLHILEVIELEKSLGIKEIL